MRNQLLCRSTAIAIACSTLCAQFAQAQAVSTAPIETVYVTGSNLKRTDKEGTSPVSVISAQDIKNTGATSVADLMKLVPSMGSNSNQDNTGGSGFAKGVATASLRGLGSSSTLILLNGRRITPAPYADPNQGNSVLYDLNSIPLAAIARIEILQDGASAVYGSDAIAGVINFILKTNYQGAELSARTGANDDGNFRRKGFTGIFGKGDLDTDGYTFMLSADVDQRDRTALRDATDLHYSQAQLLNGRFASDYGSSVSQYPTYYRERVANSKNFGVTQATAPANMSFNLGCPAGEQLKGSTALGMLPTNTLIGRTFCNYNSDQFLEAQGDSRDINLLAHGELKIGAGVTGFSDVEYSHSRRDYTGVPITIGTTSVGNFTATGAAASYQTILPIGHPDNPYTDRRGSIAYRFVNLRGGSSTINEGIRAVAGLRGNNYGWDWESALLFNRAQSDSTSYGRLYLPTLRHLVDDNWSIARVAADPTIGHDVVTDNRSQISQFDFKGNREFGQLPGGAIGVAAGGEIRRESINLSPDPLVASGQIYGLANTILNSSRNVKSAFVEMRFPVLKSVELDWAGRADKYDNLARNFVPKYGAKWTVSDMFAVRGSYAKGFRAPSLSQIVPGGAQFFLNSVVDLKRCSDDGVTPKPGGGTTQDCAASVAGTGGFNPALKPETSKSYNLGFIFSPTSTFDMTVDFYKIHRENEIVLGSASEALKNEDSVPQNITRNQNPASFLVNADGQPIAGTGPLLAIAEPWKNQGMTELNGADIEGRLRNKLGKWGSLSTTLRATYTHSYKVQENVGDPVHNVVGTRPNIYDWALSSGSTIPRWKGSMSSTWTQGDHAVNLSVNYVGPISLKRTYDGDTTYAQPFCQYGTKKATDAAADRDTTIPLYEAYYPDCAIKEWVTVGIGYTYTGFEHWNLNANIQNLADTKAPYDPLYAAPTPAAVGYNANLHNAYGRYFTVSARYTF
ncbi:TonB-dependent receptor plug domain-containing protein [Massilia sp. S19_KUP03_FR1]|uniref:TonB-dependent receptor plug domain-containing protein n=1 Tax=Massilia sp. S19_KUP03_FR1 TaxID=3025503 RepID=UPI002FCD6827